MKQEVVAKVEELLRISGTSGPPVPVEAIASQLGILVIPLAGGMNISGAILRRNDRAVIAVNPSHHSNRRRFTLAHELAHFLFDEGEIYEHVDQDFRINWRNDDSSKAIRWDEIRANQFAAELLMPREFLIRDLESLGTANRKVLAFLTRRYRVSRQAMEIRLTNLGLIDVAKLDE